MLMLILGGSIILIIVGIVILMNQLLKKRAKVFSLSFILTTFLTILVPGIVVIYFLVGFTCLEGCYVKKYSPKWMFTMGFTTIGNLPIIQPKEEAQYFYDTDLGVRREVSYISSSPLIKIKEEVERYLASKNIQLSSKLSCHNGYWDIGKQTVIINGTSGDNCLMIYLDDYKSYVLVRAMEMN